MDERKIPSGRKVEELNLDFEKSNGLIPTIIKDTSGNVLTLAYSSRESLAKTLETRKGWYFSRSRNKLCMKGETSGNTQEVEEIMTDCDRDSLIFIVNQKGNACHTGKYSCFGENKKQGLKQLYEKICSRINSGDEKSYTLSLINDMNVLKRKIIEESGEVVTAKDNGELIWECADLFYFTLVIMAANGVTLEDIEKENERRDKKKE